MSRLLSRERMRDAMLGLALLCATLALMLYPQPAMEAARSGLRLCYNVIIPSLFPFFVLSSLVVELGLAGYLGRLLEGLMRPLFRVGGACASAVALGFIGGYPVGAKAAIIFASAFVPWVINPYPGIKQTKPVHLWVAQTFGASRREMLFTVAIPTALPLIFTGLRISLGTAWMTLCAAEMLASNRGLGYMIQLNRTLARADLIIVGMLTIGVVGIILTTLLDWLEKKVVKGGRR